MAGSTALHVPFTTHPPGIATQNTPLTANPFFAFFGTPDTLRPIDSYSDTNQTLRVFPEAKKGQSVFLETTFTLLALTNNAFMTTVILPLEYTNDLSFTWTEWIFHPYLPEAVPELGVCRFVQSKTSTRSKTLTRRGLGITLTHGFMETDLGRKTYEMEVRQVAQAINEGLQLEALFGLMSAQKSELDRLRQLNGNQSNVHNAHVDAIIQRELDTWAFMQQTRYAWMSLDDYVERAIETYARGGFKAWIVDIRVESFRKRVAHDQTTYAIHGPGFMDTMRQGAQHYSVDEMGNVVYATRSFLVDETQPINPLESMAQIGEYFRCSDVPDMNFTKYDSSFRTQLFYDEDGDVMKPCTLEQKVAHCGRFKPDGSLLTFSDLRSSNLNDLNDQKRDFLHYEKPSGELAPLSLFGQLKQQHFNERDYHDLARTAFSSLSVNSYEWRQYEKAFATIIKYLQFIDGVSYDSKYEAWVAALTAWNTEQAVANTGANAFPAADGAGDIKGNNTRSLNMFANLNAHGFNSSWLIVPPTHGTYGGFKTIQSMYENNVAAYFNVFDRNAAKDISEAMTIFDDFVSKVAMFFPKSLVASPTWVSPNIHNPEAHDAVFENLLSRQFPSRAIFARPMAAATSARIANEIADLYNAATLADRTAALAALNGAIAGELAALRRADDENNFATIQPSLRTLFSSITGKLEVLNAGAGVSGGTATNPNSRRANIGLQIGSGAGANFVNIVEAPDHEQSSKAQELEAALGASANRLKLWMMAPAGSVSAAAVKAKILTWLAFVDTRDQTSATVNSIAARYLAILDSLDSLIGTGGILGITSLATYTRALEGLNASIDSAIKNAIMGNPNDYSSRGANALDQVLKTINDTATQLAANAPAVARGFSDVQNFRAAPIRIGRSAFITYVKSNAAADSRFLPGSGLVVHAPMTNQELADSSSFPISQSNYADSSGSSSDIVNLPVIRNAKSRLVNGSIPQPPASSYRINEFSASARRITGMPSLNMGPDLKRARYDSSIVGGSSTPTMQSPYVEPPEFTTDNVDDVLPQNMKDTFSSLCATFNGQLGMQIIAFIFMFTPVTRQALEATINYNLLHPFDYIIARPHANYRTVASIKLQPGSETGNTLFGNMQVTVGDDTTVQVIQAQVRFYQGHVIKKPDNIFVVRNSMVVGYHGGLGSGFITPGVNSYNPSIGLFGDNPDASIIVIAIPRHERLTGRALSLSGSLKSVDPVGRVDTLGSTSGRYTYNTLAFYRRLYRWYSTQFNDYDYVVNAPGIGEIVPNTEVFSSTAIYRDPKTGQWTMGTSNLGHWRNHTVGVGKHKARIGRESFNLDQTENPFQTPFSF